MNLPALPIQEWELWNYYIILWWTCLPCPYKNENYEITTLFSDKPACPAHTKMRTMKLLHYSLMNLPALPIQEWELWNYYSILWWTCLPCPYKNENFEITTLFSDELACPANTRMRTMKLLHYSLMNLPALPIQKWELWNYYIILWWTCLPCQYKNENYEITTLFSDELACPAHKRIKTMELVHYSLMNMPALPIQEWELWNYYILWWTCLPCSYKNENYEITTLISDELACPANTRMRTMKLLHYSLMNLPDLSIQEWELWNYYIILWWTCLPCPYKNENYAITTLFSDELACPAHTRMKTMKLLHYSLMSLPAMPIQEWKLWNNYIILWWTCLTSPYKKTTN